MSGIVEPFVRFSCHACQMRLKTPSARVGQPLRCPRCGTRLIVPAGSAEPDELRVLPDSDQPSRDSEAAYGEYLSVPCPRCRTLLRPRADQVGERISCPDCFEAFTVPAPRPKPRPKRFVEDDVEEIQVAAPVERPRVEVFDYGAEDAASSGIPIVDGELPRQRIRIEAHPRPKFVFLSGIWTFLFYPGTALRWVALSVAGTLCPFMVLHAIRLGSSSDAMLWAEALAMSALSVLIGGVWVAYCCVIGNSIAVETAAGNDHIENWPDLMFLDWAYECLYLINASSLAAGLAMLIQKGLSAVGWADAGPLTASLAIYFVFPISLLSMMEGGSPFHIVSGMVLRSLRQAWAGWIIFYFWTGLLLSGLAGLVYGLFSFLPRDFQIDRDFNRLFLVVPVVMFAFVGALIVYFRLLGRLAMYCGDVVEVPELPSASPDRDEISNPV